MLELVRKITRDDHRRPVAKAQSPVNEIARQSFRWSSVIVCYKTRMYGRPSSSGLDYIFWNSSSCSAPPRSFPHFHRKVISFCSRWMTSVDDHGSCRPLTHARQRDSKKHYLSSHVRCNPYLDKFLTWYLQLCSFDNHVNLGCLIWTAMVPIERKASDQWEKKVRQVTRWRIAEWRVANDDIYVLA